jgi:putative spermidine/putrescine transport system permease protein
MTATAVREDRAVSGGARVSAALWRRSWLRATLTLSPPLAWFLLIYLASLVVMLVTAFWTVNPFTNSLVHSWTLANFQQIFTPTYLTIIARTVIMAAVVTVTDAVLALPFAYYMARVATPRGRQALFIAVLLPLWASYLARVYAWIVILQKGGTLSWTLSKLGLGTVNIGYTNVAMWIVFSYIWLPFMIVPIYGALEADTGLACWRRPATSARATGGRCAAWSCRWRCRAWWPGRSSPSRSRWATSSRRSWSAGRTRASSATSSTPTSARPATSRSPPRSPWSRS